MVILCLPNLLSLVLKGEAQDTCFFLSSLQRNVAGSVALKPKTALRLWVLRFGVWPHDRVRRRDVGVELVGADVR